VAAIAAVLVSAPAAAETLLSLPVDCRPGETCWVTKLMDHDAGPRDVDWQCGPRAPGDHSGTDFAVSDLATGAATRVLAAAPGTVLRLRDGMADANVLETGPQAIKGRECGNAVVIDHGDGLETQYCHLRQGSIVVRIGQRVERGQELGRIGLSGETELPHVHLTVRRNGQEIDPFTGTGKDGRCGLREQPLWDAATLAALPYQSRQPYRVGLAGGTLDRLAARQGTAPAPTPDSPVLVLWFDGLALHAGDTLRFVILDPAGREIFRHDQAFDRDSVQWFGFSGLKRRQPRWPAGRYTGQVEWQPAEGGPPLLSTTTVEVR
jgi:hypothetical protein